jgi:hypothetical protein
MTTKQIENIKTVNAKSVNDLEMVLLNAFEIAKKLEEVTKGEAENKELLTNVKNQIMQAIADCQTLVPEDTKKELVDSEYFLAWVAYKKAKSLNKNWDMEFDTREAAIRYLKERNLYGIGRVACQVECDYDEGTLIAYGANKREALRELKKKAAEHGVRPYNPFEK